MKKVLFLIDSLPGGGAEKVLVDLVENLDKSLFEITVATTISGGVYVEEIKKNVNYRSLFSDLKPAKNLIHKIYNKAIKQGRFYVLKYFPNKILYNKLVQDSYDIEIAFLEGHSTKILAASTNKSSKKYAWIHTDMLKNNWGKKFYTNMDMQINGYHNFDSIFCVSDYVANTFTSLTNIEKNVFTVYNPINDNRIRGLAQSSPQYIFDKSKFNVITVGRLNYQKGYDRLLEVHYRLCMDNVNYHLYILGEGEERKKLESFIEEYELEESVTLLGFHENPYPLIKQADLFVSSSRAEGYSTVVVEAAILGVPVVTTNCSGMKEILGDSEFGIITENNTESLYRGMKDILCDENLYSYYKDKIIERGNYFKLENTIEKIKQILNES